MELIYIILVWLGGLVTGLAFGRILSEEYERKFWQDSSKLIPVVMKILTPLLLTKMGVTISHDMLDALFRSCETKCEEKPIPSFNDIEKQRLEELKERLQKKGYNIPNETLKLFLDMDDEQIIKILQAFC